MINLCYKSTMLLVTTLMKIFTFSRSFSQKTVLLCQENVFGASHFDLIEEMKKNHNFIFHYQLSGRLPVEDKQ